ncbi:MAG: transcription termination factor NusA, partial [Rhizobiaceae bacterium]
EDTATEIQSRANEYINRVEGEYDAARKKLGVSDELREINGVTTKMMVKFGEDGVKSIEDFAGYSADDLVGWKERKDGETKSFDGVLTGFDISRTEAEQMVLQARVKVGWITEEEAAAEAATEEAQA